MEPNLWNSTTAVWAVYGQWMASALLQHVWPDMEPARIWNGVSFSLALTFWAVVKLRKLFVYLFCSVLIGLTLCFLRQSQSSGWMGGFGSQSAQAAAPQGPVMSSLGNYNMAGYQTQWAGCRTKGIFLSFFFFPIWSTAVVHKRQGPYSQSLFNGELLFNSRFVFTVVFYSAQYFDPDLFNTLYTSNNAYLQLCEMKVLLG